MSKDEWRILSREDERRILAAMQSATPEQRRLAQKVWLSISRKTETYWRAREVNEYEAESVELALHDGIIDVVEAEETWQKIVDL